MIIEIISMSLAAFSVGFVAAFMVSNYSSSRKSVITESEKKKYKNRTKQTRLVTKRRLWTDSEEKALRSMHAKKYTQAQMGRLLGRPQTSIHSKMLGLKLIKPQKVK